MSTKITGLEQYTTAADPNRGGLGAFNAFFGNSAKQFAAGRELDADGEIKANWKDRLFGHSTEELTEEYMKGRERTLRNDPRVQALQAEGQEVAVDTTGGQLAKMTKDLNNLTAARSAAGAAGYMGLTALDDPNAIYAGIKNKNEAKVKADRDEGRAYAEGLADKERIRQDGKEAIARLDRLSREKSELAMRRDEMEYRYAAMARQDRLDAPSRKDKAIMALMQGLGNLGAAFTI